MAGYLIGGRLVAGGGLGAGEITVRAVPASGASFELPLNGDGSLDIDVNLPMIDPVTGVRVDLPNLLVPGRDYLAWVEQTIPGNRDGDVILEAGPIWGDPFTFPQNGRIIANGILSYFDHRFILPVLTTGQLPRDVTSKWTGLSLRTIAKRIVQQAVAHPSAALPIDFEDDIAGDHEREYPGSDLKKVAEALRDLTQVESGPDITFRPEFTEDRRGIRWNLVTGDPELKQGGADHYWDVSVPDAHARIVEYDRDGSELSSRDFHVGASLSNLLSTDPSFETGIDGVEAGASAGSLTWATDGGYEGSKHISWGSTAGSGYSAVNIKQSISVEEGEPLMFSFWGHNGGTGRPMGGMIRYFDEDGTTLSDHTGPSTAVAAAPGYTRVDTFAEAPAGATTAKCYIFGYPSASGQGFGADAIMALKTTEILPFTVDSIEVQATASDPSLTDAGFPLLESVTDRSSVKLTSTLQAYSNEAVLRGSAHIETFTIVARRDKAPRLGTYWPGDYATVNVGTNHRIPQGKHRVRIVGLQFGKTGDVTIQCAPERVVSGYPVPSTKRTWLRDKLRTLSQTVMETTRGK